MKDDNKRFGAKQLLVARNAKLCQFTMEKNSTVYIFGGEAFKEERFIDWNFVSSDKNTLKAAREKWQSGDWEKIKTDPKDFVPYPSR